MARNKILQEDLDLFQLPQELAEALRNSTVIVTGSTGLVGSAIVRCLHASNLGIRFILPVRNRDKALRIFAPEIDSVTIFETDLTEFFNGLDSECGYVIHCASPTNGKYISAHPAETFLLQVDSTRAILDYARRCSVRGVVYLSSIEYYGQYVTPGPVTEEKQGFVDHRLSRSSYALGKQAAEYLCFSYAREYGVPAKIARLTQTFGAGVPKEDNRVFAQFARSVIAGTDIVLHTEGKSAKPYCYITDCVAAIMYVMLKGAAGEAYNVATPGTYVTVREFADLFRALFNPEIDVKVEPLSDTGYAPDTTVNLDARKLQQLGWQPRYGLKEMMSRLVDYLRAEK